MKFKTKENIAGYIFILPWIIGLTVFTLGPILFSFYTSFTDYAMTNTPKFTGLANYRRMFTQDPLFWKSLSNTLYYVALEVPLVTILGIVIAVMLNEVLVGIRIYRTIFYLPSIMVGIGTYFLWMMMLNPSTGIVNSALALIGIDGPSWLTNPAWTKPAIVLMKVWGVGGQMLLYLARLRSIPLEYYEAGSIDGTTMWTRIRYITLPMITPIIFYNLIIGIVGSFQIFQEGYVLSGDGSGAPANSLLFYNLYIWKQAFTYFRTGYASALSWVMFLMVLVLTLINLALSRRWVFYEEDN